MIGWPRVGLGSAIALVGIGLCVGIDAYFVQTGEFGGLNEKSLSLGVDLWMALPLVLLAGLTLAGALSYAGALIGLVAVGSFTGLMYWDVLSSDSSTAALGILFGPIYSFIAVVLLWGGDALVRAAVRHLREARRRRAVTGSPSSRSDAVASIRRP